MASLENSEKEVCVIDIDGTFLEKFKEIYNQIMQGKLFVQCPRTLALNRYLNQIKDLDLISNSMWIFRKVMILMTLCSLLERKEESDFLGKKSLLFFFHEWKRKYKVNLLMYEDEYIHLAESELEGQSNENLKFLKSLGYDVILVSHNVYTKKVKGIQNDCYTPKNKRQFFQNEMSGADIKFVIGNNFMDDIVSTMLLNRKYKKEKNGRKAMPIYIGKSKIVLFLMKRLGKSFSSFHACIEYISMSDK